MVIKTTGNVYEKRLLEKYLETHHKDPSTGESLAADDILPLKGINVTLSLKLVVCLLKTPIYSEPDC